MRSESAGFVSSHLPLTPTRHRRCLMAARKKIRSSRVNIDRELDAAVSIPIEHRKPPIRSARAARVADMFGITRFLPASLDEARRGAATYVPVPRERLRALLPGAGRIVLLTGPSGAGKSSVL